MCHTKGKVMNATEALNCAPGEGQGFERIRRITGYLVGAMDKWNDAKKSEESERVKHGPAACAKGCQA